MTQSPVTVTYSLEDVLEQINHKLDDLQKDVTNLRVGQAEIKPELTALKDVIVDVIIRINPDISLWQGKLGSLSLGCVRERTLLRLI